MIETLNNLGVNEQFFIHFGLFIVVWAFLYFYVFKAYFAAYNERQSRTEGRQDYADRIVEETKQLEQAFAEKARDLSRSHKSIFDQSRSEALKEHDKLVSDAKAKARSKLEQTKDLIQKEIESSNQQLEKEVPALTETIVGVLLGKGVKS